MRKFPELRSRDFKVFRKLDSPTKVQDLLDRISMNFEEVCRSPLYSLREGKAHCMEGAMLAAAAFWYHGQKPLLLDLRANANDEDHVVALFKGKNGWGAVSKTNHPVLRYRDPVYKTVRELAMSYFNEYFIDSGEKTLRSHSKPFDLSLFGDSWLTTDKDMSYMEKKLDRSPHIRLIAAPSVSILRRADPFEIKATGQTEWKSRRRTD